MPLNLIILGVTTGSGVVIKGFIKIRKYDRKIDMFKFAFTSYRKVINKITACLRGEAFNVNDLLLYRTRDSIIAYTRTRSKITRHTFLLQCSKWQLL